MKKKNLEQVKKNLAPLTQSEKGKLRGGFSVFGASTEPSLSQTVQVLVEGGEGSTCGCGCSNSAVQGLSF